MWGYGYGWAGMFWMGLGLLLFLALLAAAIWALARWSQRNRTSAMPPTPHVPPNQPSALEVLRQRYARGEIDATTFENMRERLQAADTPERPPVTTGR
jgi:uncharacterized membrane protein